MSSTVWQNSTPPTIPGSAVLKSEAVENLLVYDTFTVEGSSVVLGTVVANALDLVPSSGSVPQLEFVATANSELANITTITNAPMAESTTISIPDPGAATANFLLNSGINTMAVGGTIVYNKVGGTEASNVVTANGACGVITTSSLTTAAGSSYVITWTNSFITATSVIMLSTNGGTSTTGDAQYKVVPSAGNATLTIFNAGTAAFNGTFLIGYHVL